MVQKWPDDSEMQDGDRSQKKNSNRFFYQTNKPKDDPWSTIESNERVESNVTNGFSPKFGKPIKNENKTLSSHSDFNLESVWSVKNVPLPSTKKPASQVVSQTGKSYFSRHGGLSNSLATNNATKSESPVDSNKGPNSWSMNRQGYSYANQGSVKRQADDDDDEFDFTEPKKRSAPDQKSTPTKMRQPPLSTTAAPLASVVNPQRRESARTQRAKKMNEAYLRSTGLGGFTREGEDDM